MLRAMRPQGRPHRSQRRVTAILGALVVGVLTACGTPSPTPSVSTPTEEPAVIDTSTLRTMIDSPREQSTLVIGEATEESDDTVTSYAVTYDSAGLTISGVLRVPTSEGPHPAVVVVHGGVDPERYVSGGDLEEEQRALVASGYVVFATDLRGYADSDPADSDALSVDPDFGWSTVLDWGMAWDVVNALDILRSGQVPGVDPERIGVLGHSMGGLLALDAAVIAPGSSDMIVALSAPSSSFGELIQQYEESAAAKPGSTSTPTHSPEYWADVSPANFLDRATEPLFMIHGSTDRVALPEWSEQTVAAWKAAGLPAEVIILAGADHALRPKRVEAAALTLAAFDATIGTR